MNRDTNKRGRGRPPKGKGVDLGRKNYIQEIISRAKSRASSRAYARVISHTRSKGQSVSQPKPPPIEELQFREEEVASKVRIFEGILGTI